MPVFKHSTVANLSWSGTWKHGKTSCFFSPFTTTPYFSLGFLLALCLLLSSKWLKHSQIPTTCFGWEGLSLKRELFCISYQGRSAALVICSTMHETTQKAEKFQFAQLPVLPCSSHGEHFKISAKKCLNQNAGFATQWLQHILTLRRLHSTQLLNETFQIL